MQTMFKWFVSLLFFKALLLFAALWFFPLPLSPDEAQYWVWSQKLNFGYYSKPPGIAWAIALTTFFGGQNELFVRFSSLVFSFFTPFLIRLSAKAANFSEREASLAGLVFAFSPIGVVFSYLAITDVGMLFFWSCALYQLTLLCFQNKGSYLWMGVFTALSCLFKWTGFLFLLIAFFALWKEKRLQVRPFCLFVVIALFSLLPSLLWNLEHDFATFRHVAAQTSSTGDGKGIFKGNILEFALSQMVLFGPVFFLLAIFSSYKFFSFPSVRFFLKSSFALLFVYALLSLVKKIQGNWADFAFIALAPLAVLKMEKKRFQIAFGFFVNALLVFAAVFSPFAPIPYKSVPLKNMLGWEQIANALKAYGYDPSKHYLLSDYYQGVSELSFYSPEKTLAYYLPLEERRRNQFTYFPSYLEEKKQEGIFVFFEQSPHLLSFEEKLLQKEKSLKRFFSSVSYLGKYPLYKKGGIEVKNAYLFSVKGTKRLLLKESSTF